MSRSAFAARFTALTGEPVMQYVSRWRMQCAADALQQEDLSMAAIAERVGYDSEAAFGRAFKRVHGISPGRARRRPGRTAPGRT
jgi:AraC-like DNA-binding protein